MRDLTSPELDQCAGGAVVFVPVDPTFDPIPVDPPIAGPVTIPVPISLEESSLLPL